MVSTDIFDRKMLEMGSTLPSQTRSEGEASTLNTTYFRLLAEVEDPDFILACDSIMTTDEWFPRASRILSVAGQFRADRLRHEEVAIAQETAQLKPLLSSDSEEDDDDMVYDNVNTRDLPPGYNYANDIHWQHGMALLTGLIEGQEEPGSLGKVILDIYQRKYPFEGASKDRDVSCPACHGARFVRLGGWDAHPNDIGSIGSAAIRCPTCSPGGVYDAKAEQAAIRARSLTPKEDVPF